LPGSPHRPEQVPDEAAVALRPRLRIRANGRGGGRRRRATAGRRWRRRARRAETRSAGRGAQPLAALGGPGGFGTHAVVNAGLVMPLPAGFPFDDAAAFILTYGATHHHLVDRGPPNR